LKALAGAISGTPRLAATSVAGHHLSIELTYTTYMEFESDVVLLGMVVLVVELVVELLVGMVGIVGS